MEWSEVNLIKLIDAYRKQFILWDPLHRDHYKKHMKADAWHEISVEMYVSAEQCKKKIISLLSSYRREKCKMKNNMGTGKGRDDVYVSRWFAYEAFRFLEDRDVPRKRLTTETVEIQGIKYEIEAGINISEEATASTASTSTLRPAKRKCADHNDAESLEKEPCNKPNEIDAFFTYVAAKVNKYSPETQQSVQHAVFDVLVKADKGLFDCAAPNARHFNNWQNPSDPTHSQQYVLQPVLAPMQSPSDSSISTISSQPSPADLLHP